MWSSCTRVLSIAGLRLSSDVVDMISSKSGGPSNVILDQVTNGVAIRMAIFYLLLGKQKKSDLRI